uniref:Uncharacterized protein n=1 Tax=Knipowitschia caucasica TaxID=637954 RepID=A0AAV2JDC6_KNICA
MSTGLHHTALCQPLSCRQALASSRWHRDKLRCPGCAPLYRYDRSTFTGLMQKQIKVKSKSNISPRYAVRGRAIYFPRSEQVHGHGTIQRPAPRKAQPATSLRHGAPLLAAGKCTTVCCIRVSHKLK